MEVGNFQVLRYQEDINIWRYAVLIIMNNIKTCRRFLQIIHTYRNSWKTPMFPMMVMQPARFSHSLGPDHVTVSTSRVQRALLTSVCISLWFHLGTARFLVLVEKRYWYPLCSLCNVLDGVPAVKTCQVKIQTSVPCLTQVWFL